MMFHDVRKYYFGQIAGSGSLTNGAVPELATVAPLILAARIRLLIRIVRRAPSIRYTVKVGDLQWVRIPPGKSIARPEAARGGSANVAAPEPTSLLLLIRAAAGAPPAKPSHQPISSV